MTKQQRVEANERNFPFDYTTDEIRAMYDEEFEAEYDRRNVGDRFGKVLPNLMGHHPFNNERIGFYEWAKELGVAVEKKDPYPCVLIVDRVFDDFWKKVRAIRAVRERERFAREKNEKLMADFRESRGSVVKEMPRESDDSSV